MILVKLATLLLYPYPEKKINNIYFGVSHSEKSMKITVVSTAINEWENCDRYTREIKEFSFICKYMDVPRGQYTKWQKPEEVGTAMVSHVCTFKNPILEEESRFAMLVCNGCTAGTKNLVYKIIKFSYLVNNMSDRESIDCFGCEIDWKVSITKANILYSVKTYSIYIQIGYS